MLPALFVICPAPALLFTSPAILRPSTPLLVIFNCVPLEFTSPPSRISKAPASLVKLAIPSEFETVPEISKPVPVLWLYISRLPAFVTVPEIFNRPAVFEISALPSLVTVPEMSKPLEPALDISSSLILLTEPAIVNPEPLLVIVIFWLELSPMTLPEPETRNLPALFVIVADPFELCTVPSMLKPLLPELVISNVVPEFETVPLMSNILFVLSRSADPALLVTEPSIVKPPSPEFVIAILVPSFCTSPPS